MDFSIDALAGSGVIPGGTGAGGPLAQLVSHALIPYIDIAAPYLDARRKKRLTFDESKREWIKTAGARNVSSTGG